MANKKTCYRLIGLYKSMPNLWDPDHGQYNDPKLRTDTWNKLAKQMNLDVKRVKKTMNHLLDSYSREKRREHKRLCSGGGYGSTWFAFRSMEFLKDKHQKRPPRVPVVDVSTSC